MCSKGRGGPGRRGRTSVELDERAMRPPVELAAARRPGAQGAGRRRRTEARVAAARSGAPDRRMICILHHAST